MGFELWVTGDVMVERPVPASHARFGRITDALRASDDVFLNVELPLTDAYAPADKLVRFRGSPHLAKELSAWGATVGTVANNHAYDQGQQGLLDTLVALRESGIAPVGGGTDLTSAFAPHVAPAAAGRVAYLGLASTLPVGCGAGPDRPGIAPVRVLSRFVVDPVTLDEQPGTSALAETTAMVADVRIAEDAVRAAKERADTVVVACHWGVPHGWVAPYQGELADYQQPLGHALIDAGADVVLGHHPHVLHGVETYRGRPIFYSLGNFLFHAMSGGKPPMGRPEPEYSWQSLRGRENRYGGVVRLYWAEPAAAPVVELVPVLLDDEGVPGFAEGDDAEHALARVEQLSEKFTGTRLRRGSWHDIPTLQVDVADAT